MTIILHGIIYHLPAMFQYVASSIQAALEVGNISAGSFGEAVTTAQNAVRELSTVTGGQITELGTTIAGQFLELGNHSLGYLR